MLTKIEGDQYKKRPDVKVGDTVRLHMRIKEGDKERIQVFEGIVISLKGSGMSKTMTVRKISMGVGVERIVPFHSPLLDKIEIVKRAQKTLRSKLYHMRKQVGRKASKISGSEQVYMVDEEDKPEAEEEPTKSDSADTTKTDVVIEDTPATAEAKEESGDKPEEQPDAKGSKEDAPDKDKEKNKKAEKPEESSKEK